MVYLTWVMSDLDTLGVTKEGIEKESEKGLTEFWLMIYGLKNFILTL